MPEDKNELNLIEAFKRMSFEGRADVMGRALLVEKIENGIRRECGLLPGEDGREDGVGGGKG